MTKYFESLKLRAYPDPATECGSAIQTLDRSTLNLKTSASSYTEVYSMGLD